MSATADLTDLPWQCRSEKSWAENRHRRRHAPSDEAPLLRLTRKEYEEFTLEVFLKHIYQEVDSRSKRAYRFEKKRRIRRRAAVSRIEREAIARFTIITRTTTTTTTQPTSHNNETSSSIIKLLL
jgi:hypothetical protein